ncbi:MAG: CPBP family intramembrane metalloprotease [Actinomycetota bacterium]|nr:CPBP family intramembrane metalloprotease [Actinomycetota bacterium]
MIATAVMTRMRWWRDVGFRGLTTLRDLRFFWIPLFPVLPAAVMALSAQGAADELDRLGRWIALAVLVGFVEEVAFRGLILRALAPGGVRRAAIISAVLFGLMHVVNLLIGADLGATLLQVGYATAMGFAFGAAALRTDTIWPLVLIHALIDLVSFVAADGTRATGPARADVLTAAVYVTMFTVYGLLVLRTVRSAPGCRGKRAH